MICLLAAVLSGAPVDTKIAEAIYAIEAKRIEQARQMVTELMAANAPESEVQRILADLAFAEGKWSQAHSRYLQLISRNSRDIRSAERAGVAAMMTGQTDVARPLIQRAVAEPGASWRAWNARGVLADLDGDWTEADRAYSEASRLGPKQAEVLNNHGWSFMLRGEWEKAAELLTRALVADSTSVRTANNLELARAMLTEDLPQRRAGESASEFAARLNDAGVAAQLRGDRTKAIAAFSRALSESDSWYKRAATNLAIAQVP